MKNIFKIHFHPLFYIVIIICSFTGHFQDFFLFLSIILFHELGHILGGFLFKWKIKEVLILPFGALTIFGEGITKPLKQEFYIAILGPVFQLIYYHLFRNTWNITALHYSLLLFNLLPITPLDGSKILNVLLNKFFPFKKSNWLTILVSTILVITLFGFSLIYRFNFVIIFVLFFLSVKIYQEFQNRFLVFQKFLYERYFYPRYYRKLTKVSSLDVTKMYRDRQHIFFEGGKSYSEREILRKRFDFKGKL